MEQRPGHNGRQGYAGILICAAWLLFLAACRVVAQTAPPAAPQSTGVAGEPVLITLEEAIHRAQANEPGYAAAMANSRIAALDRTMAKTALLPSVVYHNQYLYTEPNGESVPPGTQPTQKFIANNGVREYASQGMVDELIGVGPWRRCAMPTQRQHFPRRSWRLCGEAWWRR